ncbi:PAS domain-containing protein [Leptolyngbya sp. FACHB-711]|uniref:PAS domain-containing protein n=2 Tax=unclassified Leptolyngbya TaxID=2650499 RepID=UPI001687DCEF|nr:PAS domain-containing protein [Leptolyngbya sp. FACHB-711]
MQFQRTRSIGKPEARTAMSTTGATSLSTNEQDFLECFGDGMAALDREWRLTYLNRKQAEWFDLPKQEVLGKTIWEVCPQWTVPEMQGQLQQAMTHQTPVQVEYCCPKRQGWFELRVYPSPSGITVLTIDITERKHREEALRESELRFQAFMNHCPASAWITSESGQLLYLSPFYLETFSCDQDAVGKYVADLFPPETAQQFLQNDQYVFETGEVLQTVEYAPGSDGSVKSFLVSKFPMKHPSGEKLLGGFAVDITEQKRIEAALQEREQHLKIALRTAKLGSWQHDLMTNTLICSDQCKANFGLPPDAEFTHEILFAALHPDDRDHVQAAIRRSIEERTDYEVEERCFHPDGSLHWLIARGGLICDEGGNPIRLVGVTLDITERKQFEESLQEANQKVSEILESITDAFITFDQDWHYTYVNQEAARLLGKLPEELLGRRWQDVFPDVVQQKTIFAQQFQRAMAERVTVHFEGFSAAANRWLEAAVFPAANGIAVFFRDIGDRKQEEQRKALQYSISQILAEATTVAGVVPTLLQTICEALGWQVGIIWSLDHADASLHCMHSWFSGAELAVRANPFIEACQRAAFEFGLGLPGRIWKSRQSAWIPDLSRDSNFPRLAAASDAGLQAGFGFPILLADDFFGVIECYSDRTQEPDEDLLQLMTAIGRQIGQFMERKRTEAALRESEELFQSFMNNSPVAAYIKDESGQYVYVNAVIERLFEHPASELVGRRDTDWFPSQAIEQIHANDAAVFAQNQALQFLETVPFGEQVRHFMAFKFPLRDASGKRLLGGVSADITDRVQAEAFLRQREEELRVITNTVPVLISFVDADQRYRFNSQRYQSWLGQSPAEIQGQYLWNVLGEAAYTAIRPYVEQALSGQAVTFESEISYQDGATRYISASYIPQFDEQQVTGFVALVSDISDRRQAEQEREQLLAREQAAREQAETANRLKDEFLAILSHELRSPLNPILGWTRLLRSREFAPEARDRALETIERNAKLQTQLIEDLLDVSRILRGKLLLDMQPVNLAMVIDSALETVRLAAEAKGIAIQKQLPEITVCVSGDSSRLQQIVWNLISNAVKFTPTGGQVNATLKRLENEAIIQVKDTGKGIAAAFLPHVFDYFRQEDSTTTRKFGGLGLGLAIVRYLTELHGGTVEVESAGANLGTTFTVRLPLLAHSGKAVNSQQNGDSDWTERSLLANLRILAVDDEADMRELLATILTGYGAEVEVVSSAQAVLAALDRTVPDVLISDIGMPDIDGYALIQRIRMQPPEKGGNVLAVALTAYAGEINEQQAHQAGFQQHIAKPVEPEELGKAIVNLLARQSNR